MIGELATALASQTALYLRLRMRELGRKYGVVDVTGLSIALWRTTQETPEKLSEDEALELEQLSYQCGGWWDLKEKGEDAFVTAQDWDVIFASIK